MINLLRPALGITEPLTSYASRLAMMNGADSMQHFLAHMGIPEDWIINCRQEGIMCVADLGRVCSQALGNHSLIRSGKGFRLNRQVLSRSIIRRTRLRVCLECLQEDIKQNPGPVQARPYCRSIWLLSSIYYCPTHSRQLFELPKCPQQGLIHDFSRRVESLLPDLDNLLASQGRLASSDYEQYAANRVCGLQQAHTWLDTFPFYAVDRMVINIGAVSDHGSEVKIEQLNDHQIWQASNRGFEVARQGKVGIESLLLDLGGRFLKTRHDWGPKDLYGRLYEWLAHETEDTIYNPLREIMFQFTNRMFPVGSEQAMFGTPFPLRLVHSVRSVSIETGVHPKRLRKLLLKAGFLSAKDRSLSDDRILFSAEAASSTLDALTGSFKFNELAAYLNIPRGQMVALKKANIFEPDIVFDTESGKARAYSRQKLDTFMETLRAGGESVQGVSGRLIQIPDASKRACCSAAETVRLILAGRLMRKGILTTEKGYMAILVDPEEIKPLVRREDHGGVSLRVAEKQLGVSTRVLTALIDHGYLPSREAINPINRCPQRVIEQDDIDAFQATYVGLTALRAELGKYLGDLKQRFSEADIKPCIDPELVFATFYRRSDIPNFDGS